MQPVQTSKRMHVLKLQRLLVSSPQRPWVWELDAEQGRQV